MNTVEPAATAQSGLRARLHVPGRLRAEVSADRGAVVAVVGPNGAGKTTLLRCLAGLLPSGGEIVVGSRSWTDPLLAPRERRVGYVVQGQALFPHLSAEENAAFGLRARGVRAASARERARVELERLGVGQFAARRPAQLSGGQAQRVAIARALATDPDLLLLDEPFSGLDAGVAADLRVELSTRLAAVDAVTVLVTHDAVDALTLASAMLVLQDGEVAQTGPPGEVAARPLTSHVARLVGLNVVRADEDADRLIAFPPSAVTLSTTAPQGSARLRWAATVTSLVRLADLVRVGVQTDAGPALVADITAAAAAELRLRAGTPVWASVKETATRRYRAPHGLPFGHGD